MKLGAFLIAIMASTSLLSACGRNPFDDGSRGAVAACEKALIAGLRSPSSYKRISAEFTQAGPLTRQEYAAFIETSGCALKSKFDYEACIDGARLTAAYAAGKILEDSGVANPTQKQRDRAREQWFAQVYELNQKRPAEELQTGFAKIEYDADNGFGASVRETQICRFGPLRGAKAYSDREMFNSQGDEELHRRMKR